MTTHTARILMAALAAPLEGYRRRFRLLSADTTLHAEDGREFTIPPDVLGAAAPLWEGATVKAQHARDPLKTLGQIENSGWSPASEQRPGGVDGDVVISDATQDSRDAASLLQRNLIRCASSNIAFEADEIDGMLRCTRIVKVREVSLVDEGEDPHSAALAAGGRKMDLMSLLKAALIQAGLLKEGEEPDDAMLAALLLPLINGAKAAPAPEPVVEPEPEIEPEPEKPSDAEMAKELAGVKAELAKLHGAVGAKGTAEALSAVLALQLAAVNQGPPVDVVGDALALGKISPAEAPVFRAMLAHSPQAVNMELAKRRAGQAVPTGPRQGGNPPAGSTRDAVLSAEFTAEDRAMMEANKTTPEAWAAAKAAINRKINAAAKVG